MQREMTGRVDSGVVGNFLDGQIECSNRGGVAWITRRACLEAHMRSQNPRAPRHLDECIVCPQGKEIKDRALALHGAQFVDDLRKKQEMVTCSMCKKRMTKSELVRHHADCVAAQKSPKKKHRREAPVEARTCGREGKKMGVYSRCPKCGKKVGNRGIKRHIAECGQGKSKSGRRGKPRGPGGRGAGGRKKSFPFISIPLDPIELEPVELDPVALTIEDVIAGITEEVGTSDLKALRDAVNAELDRRIGG